jgi:hypothetical protein
MNVSGAVRLHVAAVPIRNDWRYRAGKEVSGNTTFYLEKNKVYLNKGFVLKYTMFLVKCT